ncbi:pilus assembly protein TadG [Arthrobacter sp. KBS0703]|uniref:TadE/TadG family type IV pilus assembly protein n=1 Tax=Arthrobacter sp. KBS0703 TaxID=1955698 RepID=UPI00098F5521|nr:TadE/TadG family type IV pilus assembly protein [Arthrobacter sp. KBS0703]TSE14934.1 pilus assembly protein TadG [Arthrobacter sp. KBS0703]
MRRLTDSHESERGAISVIVAILLVALLGFAAIAIDVARLYSERAQLQNGSDAAAFMMAQKCAKDLNDAECSTTSPLAADLANKNAVDGLSNVKSITLDKTNRKITVTAGAKEVGGGPNAVSTFFARIMGIQSAEVVAESRVEWGTPSKGIVAMPLAIAVCKLNLAAGATSASEQLIEMGSGCGTIPGGFGWINDASDAKCSVNISAGQSNDPGIWFTSDTGASAPGVCAASDLAAMNDQTVLIPLYDIATGNGSSGKYYVKGFAAFHVTGYHFATDSWTSGGGSLPNKSIRGYFLKFVSLSQALELGNSPDYGTAVVRLTIGAP